LLYHRNPAVDEREKEKQMSQKQTTQTAKATETKEPKMNGKAKRLAAVAELTKMQGALPSLRNLISGGKPTQALAEVDAMVKAIDTTLALFSKKPKRSAEDRAKAKAERRFAKRQGKLVAWLKLDGIKAGGRAILRSEGIGGKVVEVLTDPRVSVSGMIVMDVKRPDGSTAAVDAMTYMPDFSNIVSQAKKAATAK
jgi:hypothetical protein